MKQVKCIIALLLTAVMALSLCAVAGAEAVTMTPGTYTATAQGFEGYVTVEVEVDETSIVNVTVKEITDVPNFITEQPVNTLPGLIVKNQTTNVDSITGATFTSAAIKSAVRDCLKQAGADKAFNDRVVTTVATTETEDTEVDILVIGGGAAGTMAALAAYSEDFDGVANGLSVMLVEKQAYLGGSAALAGGSIMVYYADEVTDEWLDEVMDMEMAAIREYNDNPVNEALLRKELAIMPDTYRHFKALGAELLPASGEPDVDTFFKVKFGPIDPNNAYPWFGQYFIGFMGKQLENTDVDMRLNTKATALLTDENGAVVGATVEHAGQTYSVRAKKVILASGGFPHNRELIEKYAPDYVGSVPFAAGSNTGDGLVMATDIGAAVVGNSMAGNVGSDFRMGIWDAHRPYQAGTAPRLEVNINGERYHAESTPTKVAFLHILQQPEHRGWGIVDSNNPNVAPLETSTSPNVFKADTLEELATLIGVPEDTFLASVETYNAAVAAGEDAQFGTKVTAMDAVDTAPYYAYANYPVALSSLVSLNVNEDCQVLNEKGDVIDNLYAAGDMIRGNYMQFDIGSRGINTGIYTGRMSGEAAKAAVLAK